MTWLLLVALVAAAYLGARWQSAEGAARYHADLNRNLLSIAQQDRNHLKALVAEERERNEYLGRLLDQYRAEGLREGSFVPPRHDEVPPPPPPLPKECEDWLAGLDEGVREEFEEMVRHRLASGDSPEEAIARVTGFV